MDMLSVFVIITAFIAGYSIINLIIKKLNFSQSNFDKEKKQNRKTNNNSESKENQRNGFNEPSNWQKEEKKYLDILGIDEKFTSDEIKRKYRELLSKYHPDKVNHLGEEFQQIADNKTREIIAAYDFICRKYNIR